MELSNFDYGLLFIFKVCVESNSFSKASEILHVKQPAISYSIKKLEELLNVKLFDRGNFGIQLTYEGKILYEYVTVANNNILSGLNIIEEIKTKEISQLRIGASINVSIIYLAETIKEVKKIFPNVKIYIYSKSEEIMLKELQEKILDVVIINSSKNSSIPGVKIRKIINNEIVCVGTKKYSDLFDNDNNNTKLSVPIIFPAENTNLSKVLSKSIELRNFKFEESIYCQLAIVAKQLLLADLGIGFINKEIVREELENGKLFILPLYNSHNLYSINLATLDKHLNIVIKQFIKIFTNKVTEE